MQKYIIVYSPAKFIKEHRKNIEIMTDWYRNSYYKNTSIAIDKIFNNLEEAKQAAVLFAAANELNFQDFE